MPANQRRGLLGLPHSGARVLGCRSSWPFAAGTGMTRIAVITPSYRPDFELCVDLNRSVLEFAPEYVNHQILVPRSDFALFRQLAGPRTHVRCREELLPPSF